MKEIFEKLQELEEETYYRSIDGHDPATEAVHEAIKEALIVTYTNFIKEGEERC